MAEDYEYNNIFKYVGEYTEFWRKLPLMKI